MDAVRWLAEMVQTIQRGQDFEAWYPETVPEVDEVDFDEPVWQLTDYEDATETMVILVFVPLQNTMMTQATLAIAIQKGRIG